MNAHRIRSVAAAAGAVLALTGCPAEQTRDEIGRTANAAQQAVMTLRAELTTARRDAAALDSAAHSVWLHGNWRGLTTQMEASTR